MMSRSLFVNSGKLRTFIQDKRGAVALIFAAAALVLSLVVAGSIEIHRRNQAMTELQNAADSAALAAKVEQAKKKATLLDVILAWISGKKAGESVFNKAMMNSKYFTKGKKPVPTLTLNSDDSVTVTVTVTAQKEFDLMFGGLIPAKFANISVTATANHQAGIPTEVALVLDNTASMFNLDGRANTRFTLMRDAAKKFTHQMFNAAEAQGSVADVRVSVVPWATTVNVLGEKPGSKDYTGNATVFSIKDKGSEVSVASPISRAASVTVNSALFAPVDWRGCVKGEGESTGYDDAAVSKWTALNVPETVSGYVNIAVGTMKTTTNNECSCTAYGDDGNTNCGGGGGAGPQGFNRLIERAIPQISNASMLFNRDLKEEGKPKVDRTCSVCISQSCGPVTRTAPDCTGKTYTNYRYCYAWHDNGRMNAYTSAAKIGCTQEWQACVEKAPVTENVPACVADPNEPKWIKGIVPWCANYGDPESKTWNTKHWNTDVNYYPIGGPNLNCPAPMLGLSANRKQVLDALDRMFPVPGGTHADVGLRWGLRTLSPSNNWPTFFGVTASPTKFKTESKKVMVLLTDGENEQAIDFPGFWGCSGKYGTDPSQPDCKGSPDRAELDTRMQGWCKAIRSTYGITLYAISVNVAGAAARDKLVECTGDPTKVFNVDASDLTTVLNSIGAQIMAMRLTK